MPGFTYWTSCHCANSREVRGTQDEDKLKLTGLISNKAGQTHRNIHSGHDGISGALKGSLSNRFHFSDISISAPDESPWTWQDKTGWLKLFLWARQDLNPCLQGRWNGTPGCHLGTGSTGHGNGMGETGSTGACFWLESAAAGGLGWPADSSVLEEAADCNMLEGAADGAVDFPTDGGRLEGAADGGIDLATDDDGFEGAADGGVDFPADAGIEGLTNRTKQKNKRLKTRKQKQGEWALLTV